tara:strand:+ start:2604 stop:3092 length:489 start_codon:yes stop_codon:yes gene_type:complete
MSMEWISSEGGPLILISRSSLAYWKGVNSDDYDRACAIDDYAGVISVSDSQGLVFGDEPCETAIYYSESIGVLIVRWQWAEGESSVQNIIDTLTEEDFKNSEEEIEYKSNDGSLLLFDSVLPGDEAEGLDVNLSESNYLVTTICHAPNDETSLILHRLTLKN